MADSHGRDETIAAAVAFLHRHRCERIYHLGDICDSIQPETVERCVSLLRQNDVYAIKGNNDHAVVVNQSGYRHPLLSRETLDYLRELPLVRYDHNACLTHSLPFAEERGLSSMIGTMGAAEARLFFHRSPRGLLFRGHSHTPELISAKGGEIRFQPLGSGETVDLKHYRPCIVTCGALTRGLCVIWRPASGRIDCLEYATSTADPSNC